MAPQAALSAVLLASVVFLGEWEAMAGRPAGVRAAGVRGWRPRHPFLRAQGGRRAPGTVSPPSRAGAARWEADNPHAHTRPPRRAARAADVYVMPAPKAWPLSTDATTEEVVPGLEPTDGFAIAAATPNLERFAPLINIARPVGPIMYGAPQGRGALAGHTQHRAHAGAAPRRRTACCPPSPPAAGIQKAMNASERHPPLPGHLAKKQVSLTVLVPNHSALLQLPLELHRLGAAKAFGAPDVAALARLLTRPVNESTAGGKVVDAVVKSMVMTRMVPYDYLTNATRLTNQLGAPVTVVVRRDAAVHRRRVPCASGHPLRPFAASCRRTRRRALAVPCAAPLAHAPPPPAPPTARTARRSTLCLAAAACASCAATTAGAS